MPDFVEKLVDKFIEWEHKPCVSNIIYFIGGILGLLSIFSLISSFSISVNFLDKIILKLSLNDSSYAVQIPFVLTIIYLVVYITRKIIICVFQNESNKKLRAIYATMYTIDDVVDFFCSAFSLLFMFSVFIQIYNTGVLFVSYKAVAIYVLITIKTVAMLVVHFKVRNLKIIDGVIKKYPDLD